METPTMQAGALKYTAQSSFSHAAENLQCYL